jgi:hypothetical protein
MYNIHASAQKVNPKMHFSKSTSCTLLNDFRQSDPRRLPPPRVF